MSTVEVLAHLHDARTSVVIIGDGGMPEVAYWGPTLGTGAIDAALFERPVVGGGLDIDPPVGLIAEPARGWFGRPGLDLHRPGGRDVFVRFTTRSYQADERRARFELVDPVADVSLTIGLELTPSSVLECNGVLRNDGGDPISLGALRLSLPIPGRATELQTLGGRHTMEFVPERMDWRRSCVTVENRHGKTSHERLGVVFAGTAGFGEQHGEVWACHIGWSGNFELIADAITDGRNVIQTGELLMPGEIELGPSESYTAPTTYAVFSDHGLSGVSHAFHGLLRSRERHPRSPRPVHLNTWEAVYFDHDLGTLTDLADVGARVGVERFVLDDGWFGGRRDDRRGLGDWWVAPDVWPDGLAPLIDHVRGLGMEFGIWLEPEMINVDSDLYRQHPDWVLADQRYPHVYGRNQLVLDVGRADVRDYLFDRVDDLLSNYAIDYIKWDHNRDLVAPVSDGRAGVHAQTLGVYALLDRIRAAYPNVEIETCASGGGRVDFGILQRTDRVWTSDSNDALDRQQIQSGFTMLFPPELMGSHVGAPTAHTTHRTQTLAFRAATALFGAFGVEWNLLRASEHDLDELSRWIALHKRFRDLLHTGRVMRSDHPDPSMHIHSVVAEDGSEALVSVTRLTSSATHHTPAVAVLGLHDAREYQLTLVGETDRRLGDARQQPRWTSVGLTATGGQLRSAGFVSPQLFPESTALVHVAQLAGD